MDPEGLLLKINSGKPLKTGEIEEVAALLEWMCEDEKVADKVSLDDVYGLLLVIGRARSSHHRHLLERYLDCRDALTVSLVLEILCVDWRLTSEYLERVVSLSMGAPWDDEEDVRQAALKILGEYLFEVSGAPKNPPPKSMHKRDAEVVSLLLQIFQDEASSAWTRQVTYAALCRAAGKPWSEIPSESRMIDLAPTSKDVDWSMIAKLSSVSA